MLRLLYNFLLLFFSIWKPWVQPCVISQPGFLECLWFFQFPLILIRFFLINTLFIYCIVFLWFNLASVEGKKLSVFRTHFRCDMLIARWVHHAWLSMRCACSVEHDWNVTWKWTLNRQHTITGCDKMQFPHSVLACNFSTELNLFM